MGQVAHLVSLFKTSHPLQFVMSVYPPRFYLRPVSPSSLLHFHSLSHFAEKMSVLPGLLIFIVILTISCKQLGCLVYPEELLNPQETSFPLAPTPNAPTTPPLVPALFVIGDSSVDAGTNNYLPTLARADHLPYGRDFDTHNPTGRFCNGRIPVDYIGTSCITLNVFLVRIQLCHMSSNHLVFLIWLFFFWFIRKVPNYVFSLLSVSCCINDPISVASWASLCTKLSWTNWSSRRYDTRSQLCISWCGNNIFKWF